MIEYEQFCTCLTSLQHPTFEFNEKYYQWSLDGMRDLDSF